MAHSPNSNIENRLDEYMTKEQLFELGFRALDEEHYYREFTSVSGYRVTYKYSREGGRDLLRRGLFRLVEKKTYKNQKTHQG